MTAENLGKWEITNKTYQNIETITGLTLTKGTTYLIQVEGSFFICRKSTTPSETEGFHYRGNEKTFLYVHGDADCYFKRDILQDTTTINIDEQEK